MPTYTYQCQECGASEELLMSYAAMKSMPEKIACVACGGKVLRMPCVPNIQTDNTFMAGIGTLRDQLGGDTDTVVAAAKRQGYTPSANDYYAPSLAKCIGDPAAFIPQSGGRAHVRKVCRERGHGCQGMVEVASPKRAPPPDVPLAPDIERRLTKAYLAKHPDAKRRSPQELHEHIVKTHSHKLGD